MNNNTSKYIGEIYKSEKYGDIEVIGGEYAKALTVRFNNTGFTVVTKRSHLINGLVKDKLFIPDDFKAGSLYSSSSCGDMEVVKYSSSKSVLIKFLDSGFEKVSRADSIRNGEVMDPMFKSVYGVGFLGDDNPFTTPLRHKARKYWHHMMERCYSEKYQSRKSSYIGCYVRCDWHCMANFMVWFEDNYPNDGRQYHLDKDIIVDGNRVYSAETCIFVTPAENSMAKNGTLYSRFVLTHDEHGEHHVNNLSAHARKYNINANGFSYIVNRKKSSYKGWRFVRRYEVNH